MGLGLGAVIALLIQIVPGAIVGRLARLTMPVAVAVGPALTYGVVAVATVPFGAAGIPWNAWTALGSLLVIAAVVAGLRALLARYRDPGTEALAVGRGPALVVAAGVLLGAALIGYAALRGLPHWQSIPSTWDAVWHANTVRFILDTGQASPTHMGELRNVETHDLLYYPSAFHALSAVFCQLTGAAPTTGYTLCSVAAAVWLFPLSAAVLTWRLVRSHAGAWHTAAASAAGAVLAASFTAVPYVEFGTAAMPNLVAYGLAAPVFVLITSTLGHRDRIPVAVLALAGVFSVHLTGGVIVVALGAAWWLLEALRHPVRGRLRDVAVLAGVGLPAVAVLLPQLLAVRKLTDIIAGHSFLNHLGKKVALHDAVLQHTRHLNDFGIQYALIALAAVGGLILLVKKVWWPVALWAFLVVMIVHAAAPFRGPLGTVLDPFTDLFYSDPRRISAVVTLLLAPMAGIGLFALVALLVGAVKAGVRRGATPVWAGATAVLLVAATVGLGWHYLPRHRLLLGNKYDSVMIDQQDLDALAYLATLPDAHDTLIGNANTDGTAWMYAVADLHPLWTHYDYPQQQGPGYHRFLFWAYADDADHDPRIAEAVHALDIRYVLISSPVVGGFTMPDGLVSLDTSTSWAKIYDNGGARIYEWRGPAGTRQNTH